MIGKRLGGRYEIEERVGGGGMAVVYKACDLLLNRKVAVKVLRSEYGHDEDFIRRFRREAQSAASLSHPNVVNVYDVGEDEETHYMVMEYVEGSTLKQVIKERAPLDAKEAVEIATEICKALEHAHQNRIIHRDIKPHNILIGQNGRVKVTDFGIARAVTSATITHTGSVVGSVHYFSPEQAKGGVTGEKSDIYSLGVVLYEMLTGELPFSGESPISVALKHLQDTFREPREINPDIPQSVENIIIKSLAKDVHIRYQTAKEMLDDLQTCLDPERIDEKKLELPDYDAEATKTMPAITRDMLEKREQTARDFEEEKTEEAQMRGGFPWVKTVLWLVGIILLFSVSIYGVNALKNVWYIPDIAIPKVSERPLEEAVKKLEAEGFTVHIQERHHEDVAKDHAIRTSPPAGTIVKKNSLVTLVVSLGQPAISMPDMKGMDYEEKAKSLLSDFKEVKVQEEFSDSVDAGEVISQTPAANEEVVPGETTVTVVVSKGMKNVEVPDLIGHSLEEAKSLLLQHHLTLNEEDVTHEKGYQLKGNVIWQFPYQPGQKAPPGSEITLGVSSGLLPDAKQYSEPVLIMTDEGKKADVLIVVTDASGQKRQAVNRTISKTTSFEIPMILSPQQDGIIEIYQDNSLLERRVIRYNEVGGD